MSRQTMRRMARNADTVIESEKKLKGKNIYPNSKYRPVDGTDKGRKKVYPRSSVREETRNLVLLQMKEVISAFMRGLTNA